MWERLFSRGVATSPVILAASRAWASVLRSTEVLSVGVRTRSLSVRDDHTDDEPDHRNGPLRSHCSHHWATDGSSFCRAKQVTAEAAATLRESTPPLMGIITVESQAAIVDLRSPAPSVPKTTAVRSGAAAANSRSPTESSSSASAATRKPCSCSVRIPSGQDSIRVQGTWNTVPIETLMERL